MAHLLLISPHPALREGIARVLREGGHQVEEVPTPTAATERMRERLPDLLLVDDHLIHLSGTAFLQETREHWEERTPPALLLGARQPPTGLPGVEVLPWPASAEALLYRVERILARRRSGAPRALSLDPELLAAFHHEFRTSLTLVQSSASLLRTARFSPGSQELNEFLDVILRGGERAERLVRHFLRLLQADAGLLDRRVQTDGGPVNPEDLIEGAVRSLRRLAEAHEVVLQVSLPENLPLTEGHGALLEEALGELVDNAIRFSEPGDRVLLRGWVDGRELVLAVEDEGLGITPEEMAQLGHPFQRSSRPELEERRGAGLGLVCAMKIVEAHGGRVELHPRSEGVQALLILPLRRPEEAE